MKKILIVLFIGVLVATNLNGCMFLMAGALLGEDESTSIVENNSAESIEATSEETKDDSEKSIAEIGDYFETDNLKFTITDMSLNYTDYKDEYGAHAPKDGIKYIMVSFKFENIGDENKYVSIYDFDCYADGSLCDQNFFVDNNGGFINTDLSPSRNVSFMVCFNVPADCSEIELEYKVNVWTDERIIVKLQ